MQWDLYEVLRRINIIYSHDQSRDRMGSNKKQNKVIRLKFIEFTVCHQDKFKTTYQHCTCIQLRSEVPTIASLKWQQSISHPCLHRNMFMFCGETVEVWMELEKYFSPKWCESLARTTLTVLAQNLILLTVKCIGKSDLRTWPRFGSSFWWCINTMF